MDDIIESVNDRKKAKQITDDIEKILHKGGFKLKSAHTQKIDRANKYQKYQWSHVLLQKKCLVLYGIQ